MNLKVTVADGTSEKQIFAALKSRESAVNLQVTKTVQTVLDDIRTGGDTALDGYSLKFDGSLPKKRELTRDDMAEAVKRCDEKLITALENASKNIRAYHEKQVRKGFTMENPQGCFLSQQVRALKRVGVYVPGGTAAYPSTVLMNVIPAKIAGVEEIIMATPPMKDGSGNDAILAAAYIAGADRVFLMGGSQAVAAMAYGTETVPRVDKITGPGNIYVATAKKLVFGEVDIDMVAGPSEILIIADKTANPVYLAADMMSQAEHDVLASAVLLTDSKETAEETLKQLEIQLKEMPRCEIIEKSLDDYGAIIVYNNLDDAAKMSDEFAPEHLEIMTANSEEILKHISNAGSVFLGEYTPEPLGDYYSGTNHVLPTSGTARFFSPLSVDSFVKKMSVSKYTKTALAAASEDIVRLANAEGLYAHANSVIRRG